MAAHPNISPWQPDPETRSPQRKAVRANGKLERKPIKLMISLLDRCNLRCFHFLGSQAAQTDRLHRRSTPA